MLQGTEYLEAPGIEGQGRVYAMRGLYAVREDRDILLWYGI